MEETFLHYLWKHKKFDFTKAKTTKGEEITIVNVGTHNNHSGPDFFNSIIKIENQTWAGNLEIHVKSSLWYVHNHEIDSNYDNVILHVVWEHDEEVFRKDNTAIPVLELKGLVSETALDRYKNLFQRNKPNWINCEQDFKEFETFAVENWLERLYFDRLETKAFIIFQNLEKSGNNWEEVLFKMLATNFGLNVNGDAFYSIASSIPFAVFRKERGKTTNLEALLFGQANLLNEQIENPYYFQLKNEYLFLKSKYDLDASAVTPVKYFRLRPDNFPTVRLAQLAALYTSEANLFSKIINEKNLRDLRKIFKVEVSTFWQNHYNFSNSSRVKSKKLSDSFIDLLIINTVIPVKFCFARQTGKDVENEILKLVASIKTEKNTVVEKFNLLRKETAVNALQSQALIHMKKNFCDKNQCLKCNLGNLLLR